ncbi:MAG: Tex family protein [Chthoniobacteraceae bacterium]
MNEKHLLQITQELNLKPRQVVATAVLLDDGSTVPFIARYRKEATGELDEVQIAAIRDRIQQLDELDTRRDSIVASLKERNLLTAELQAKIEAALTVTVLEDIYLPFRPKKRTRAIIAKERGLEPLADQLWLQEPTLDPRKAAEPFVDEAKEVKTVDEALAGARDIIAEKITEEASARAQMRELYLTKGILKSKVMTGKEEEGAKFKDYFDWTEPASKSPSHRILAIRRGEKEEFLFSRLTPPEDEAVALLERLFVKGKSPAALEVKAAAQDCYKRLLAFQMEGEARLYFKKKADEEAIRVFAENLRELLLASPLGQKNVLAIDPGFRTGCKVVCLDRQGKLLMHEVVYIEQSSRAAFEAADALKSLCKKFSIEAIAIGNGTAGRESEAFVKKLGLGIPIIMVNESGASIYSASEAAREEFPTHDLTVRGSVSIGRRLMDPLAELVKLDAKSIGVGQYQHDVDQNALKHSLDDVVVSCVNGVGVELNTASKQLLSYVSGLNSQIAANIVTHRNENGPFKSRSSLLGVARLGPKAYEQAAGFLRIRDGAHPLDASGVHPERYPLVDSMAADLGCTVKDLMRDDTLRKKINLQRYVSGEVGLPTLNDIMAELAKPGRDPRQKFEAFSFTEGVDKMEDLQPGMKIPGIVTNVTAFGAFVDIGVHQDGLVHISQLSDNFVKSPADVVKVAQKVMVTITEIDLPRKRIALSMKSKPEIGPAVRGGQRSDAGARPQGNAKPRDSKPAGNDWFTQALGRKN